MDIKSIENLTTDEQSYIAEQIGPGGLACAYSLTTEEFLAECKRILKERPTTKEDSPNDQTNE